MQFQSSIYSCLSPQNKKVSEKKSPDNRLQQFQQLLNSLKERKSLNLINSAGKIRNKTEYSYQESMNQQLQEIQKKVRGRIEFYEKERKQYQKERQQLLQRIDQLEQKLKQLEQC